jgi:hypothetical protein
MLSFKEFLLNETNVQRMGRTKFVGVRIRKGKIQRRKKVSAIKGFTMRGGQLVRMTPIERRDRRLGTRFAKFKSRTHINQTLRKRARSMARRKALGL